MIFDYNKQSCFTKSVQVDDIGNFALRCTSSKDLEYYIVVKTELGKTAILKFGPLIADLDVLCADYSLTYKKINYKETVIEKEILTFINDGRKEIINAEELTDFEAIECLPTITVDNLIGD